MKKKLIGFLLLAISLCMFSCVGKVPAQDSQMAADFELQDTRQDLVTLSSYRDKQSVLLFFWTTWCPFCRRELQVLNNSYASLLRDEIEVFSVNVGELPDRVSTFTRGYYLAFRVLLDKDTSVSKAYGIIGVPTYVLVNAEGNIVFKNNYFPRGYKDLLQEGASQ